MAHAGRGRLDAEDGRIERGGSAAGAGRRLRLVAGSSCATVPALWAAIGWRGSPQIKDAPTVKVFGGGTGARRWRIVRIGSGPPRR
jgi:hypothetical protein